jgi:hypothetical protein
VAVDDDPGVKDVIAAELHVRSNMAERANLTPVSDLRTGLDDCVFADL